MEIEASEITKKVKDKFEEFNSLFQTMDEDFEVWRMNPTAANISAYEADIRAKTQSHGSEITTIANELRDNCNNVQSILSSADMQIMVRMAEAEGADLRSEIGRLERLFSYAFEQADLRLERVGFPPLRGTIIWYCLVRGRAAGRFLVYRSGKNVIFDFMPMDPRWLVYEVGTDGLLWTGYKMFKSKADLKRDYDFEASKETGNEVIDWWEFLEPGKMSYAVICDNTMLKKPEILKIPSMPLVISPVFSHPPIVDGSGAQLKPGESIFASAKGVNAARNRFASMAMNYANLIVNQALLHYRAKSGGRDIPEGALFNVPGSVIELTMGEDRMEAPPMRDLPPALGQMLAMLNDQVQRTILPTFSIEQPPASGTRANLAQESADKIFNPQLRTLNTFYSNACRLIEEQVIAGGIKVKVQNVDEENKKYYETEVTPVNLKRPHIVHVSFTARTPWQQLDTAQIADMLSRAGVPQSWLYEHVYKFQDPKGMQDLAAIEVFENSPEGLMLRAIKALLKQERWDEAKAVMEDLFQLKTQEAAATEALRRPREAPAEGETIPSMGEEIEIPEVGMEGEVPPAPEIIRGRGRI